MKKILFITAIIAVVITGAYFLLSNVDQKIENGNDDVINVMVSILPQINFVEKSAVIKCR